MECNGRIIKEKLYIRKEKPKKESNTDKNEKIASPDN